MTDTARSVFTPVAIVADEVIDTARSSLVTVSPILAAGAAAANPVRLAAILQELAADAAQTLAARSHDEFCAAMKAWGGEDLVELATVVLTPLGAAEVVLELLEALVIEALRFKFPRLASILSLAGVIVDDPGLGRASTGRRCVASCWRRPTSSTRRSGTASSATPTSTSPAACRRCSPPC